MDFIKSFTEFIFEARRSKHFMEQSTERVEKLAAISFSPDIARSIRLAGLSPDTVRQELMAKIKELFFKESDKIENRDFVGARGVPAGAFKVIVGNTESWIKMTMKSPVYKKDRSGSLILDADGNRIVIAERTYVGEKIYVCINDNTMTTVKVYPIDMREEDISLDMTTHFSNKGRDFKVDVRPLTDDYVYELRVLDDGQITVNDDGLPRSSGMNMPTREQQWSIRPGEVIKLDIPFKGGFTEVVILEITNPQIKMIPGRDPSLIWKDDETIKVAVGVEKDGKQLKLMKSLAPDTILYLPVGANRSMVRCQVTGKLIDKRQPNPVNLKYKSLE